MIRLIITMAILAGMAACASSAPPAAAPAADSAATANTGNEAVAEDTAGSGDEKGVIEAVEAPQVEKTADLATEPSDELVCHRERLTGSHRFEKICRYRSEIDRTREETQKVLRRMDRQTSASSNSN